MWVIVLLLLILAFSVFWNRSQGENFYVNPHGMGWGEYPSHLYGEPTTNRYYTHDLKAALRYANA